MRARIAITAAAVGLILLGAAPAAAEECPLADTILEQCSPPEPPPPAPQPEPVPQPPPPPEPVAPPSVLPGHQGVAVDRLLVLLNDERRNRGLAALSLREDVSAQSRPHSEAMAAAGTIRHNDAYFVAANKQRLGAALLGENVARNVDIDDAHRRLMNSPGHRANILDGRFSVIGLAVYRSTTGSLYVTESFLQPVRSAGAAALPAARTVPAPTTTVPPPAAAPAPAPVAEPIVLTGGPQSHSLAAPGGLAHAGHGSSRPGRLLVTTVLLLAAAGGVVARRRHLFAPLLYRIGR